MTYATADELAEYLASNEEVWNAPEGDDAEALIERAELDVDRALGPLDRDPITGLKLDPATLTTPQRAALARATCAAAEFRLTQGEEDLVGADDGISSVGSLSFRDGLRPRPPGLKALEELSGFGFEIRSGTVSKEA